MLLIRLKATPLPFKKPPGPIVTCSILIPLPVSFLFPPPQILRIPPIPIPTTLTKFGSVPMIQTVDLTKNASLYSSQMWSKITTETESKMPTIPMMTTTAFLMRLNSPTVPIHWMQTPPPMPRQPNSTPLPHSK